MMLLCSCSRRLVLTALLIVLPWSSLASISPPRGFAIANLLNLNGGSSMEANKDEKENHDVIVRFYFVRHGQTQANLDGIVVGQLDSPLTDLGKRQAQAAGQSGFLPNTFWRRFSSDLGRAQATAQLILQGITEEIEVLKFDKRLRERAKGVREGLSKQLTYEQALEQFNEKELPLYETEDDVWDRVQEWLEQIVGDAVEQEAMNTAVVTSASGEATIGADGSAETDMLPEEQSGNSGTATLVKNAPRIYSVFCVSHSGALRAVIRKLVGDQLPPDIDLTPAGKDGAKAGMLYIPNTSVTIIDIIPDPNWSSSERSWTARLVELTHADHLETLEVGEKSERKYSIGSSSDGDEEDS